MHRRWSDGVICGSSEIRIGIIYTVSTPDGVVVMYPRAHEKIHGLKLGSYVRVTCEPSRSDAIYSQSEEVQVVEWNEQPTDHDVKVNGKEVVIKCNSSFLGQEHGLFIFENSYLGRLGLRDNGVLNEKNLNIGRVYRSTCRFSKERNGVSTHFKPIVWIMEDIDYADRHLHTGRWFEGVVTKSSDNLIIITAPDLPEDVFLYDWKKDVMIKHESTLGRWIRFQVDARSRHDHGLRYRAINNFSEIESVYKTRVSNGYTELLVRCKWNGEMEDSRALLNSEIGPIRDVNGILDTSNEEMKGEYNFWVVTYFRQHHSARWRLSIYDNDPIKINGTNSMEVERGERSEEHSAFVQSIPDGQSNAPKKDARIIEMMQHFMKFESVRDSFIENDRESVMKIKAILDRYGKK